jgi:hypothetical protein
LPEQESFGRKILFFHQLSSSIHCAQNLADIFGLAAPHAIRIHNFIEESHFEKGGRTMFRRYTWLTRLFVLTLVIALLSGGFALPVQAETTPATPDELMQHLENALIPYYPTDIEGHWAANNLLDLVWADVLKGYGNSDGTVSVKPNNPITRGEFVTLLVRAMNLTSTATPITFTDVPSGTWFTDPVRIASSLGIVTGYGSTFAPGKNINRDEIAAMVVRAFTASVPFGNPTTTAFTALTPGDWSIPFIAKASHVGIIKGASATTFRPKANANRAEAMTMLSRALHQETAALPNDATLTDLVLSDLRQREDAFNSGQLDSLQAANDRNTTGMQHAMYASSTAVLVPALDMAKSEGVTVAFRRTGTPSATVTQKNTRFATVNLTGGGFELTLTYPGQPPETLPFDSSGPIYLRKMADNTWKIYGMEQNNPMAGGTMP